MNFKKYHVSRNLFPDNAVRYENAIGSYTKIVSYTGGAMYILPIANGATYTCKIYTPDVSISVVRLALYDKSSPSVGDGVYGLQESLNQVEPTLTITNSYNMPYLIVQISGAYVDAYGIDDIMLNAGSTPLPYEPYSSEVWHDIPHYIHKTDTDILTTLPADIYPTGTTATVGLNGNEQHTGTPTPDNPIMPQGTGDRTGNLLNPAIIENGYNINTSGDIIVDNRRIATTQPIDVTSENTVTITYSYKGSTINCIYAIFSGGTMVDRYASAVSGTSIDVSGGDKLYLCWYRGSETITKDDISNLMLNTGSTPLPYEPYGYFIEIEVS